MSGAGHVYEATNGPNWLDDSGWLQTTTPCSWLGVTCTTVRPDAQIFFNNLQGQLPASLADLTQLRVLDLHNNALTGTIPALITAVYPTWNTSIYLSTRSAVLSRKPSAI